MGFLTVNQEKELYAALLSRNKELEEHHKKTRQEVEKIKEEVEQWGKPRQPDLSFMQLRKS